LLNNYIARKTSMTSNQRLALWRTSYFSLCRFWCCAWDMVTYSWLFVVSRLQLFSTSFSLNVVDWISSCTCTSSISHQPLFTSRLVTCFHLRWSVVNYFAFVPSSRTSLVVLFILWAVSTSPIIFKVISQCWISSSSFRYEQFFMWKQWLSVGSSLYWTVFIIFPRN